MKKEKMHCPYNPIVTVKQMLAFDAADPETHTASPFVNAFLEVFYDTESDAKDIAEIMGLTYNDLRVMLKVEAGIKFADFHDYWMAYKLNVALATNPDMGPDKLAKHIGFANRSALWLFYNSKRYKKIAAEMNGVVFPKPQKQFHH